MNKRIIFKYKISKRYLEDFWGIFYRKQTNRDFKIKRLFYYLNKQKLKLKKNSYFKNRKYLFNKNATIIATIRKSMYARYLLKNRNNIKSKILNISYSKVEFFISFFIGFINSNLIKGYKKFSLIRKKKKTKNLNNSIKRNRLFKKLLKRESDLYNDKENFKYYYLDTMPIINDNYLLNLLQDLKDKIYIIDLNKFIRSACKNLSKWQFFTGRKRKISFLKKIVGMYPHYKLYNSKQKLIFRKIGKRKRGFLLHQKFRDKNKMFNYNMLYKTGKRNKNNFQNTIYHNRILKVWKLRKFYGNLTEYQLKHICLKAYRTRGNILINFISLLEKRIDTILYRSGCISSIFEARQLISHRKILINNNIVNIRSYILKSNDILSFNNTLNLKSSFKNRIYKKNIILFNPTYLEINYKLFNIIFIHKLLNFSEVSYNFKLSSSDINSILYYYYY